MQGDQQMPGLGTFPVNAVVVQLDVGNGAVDLQSLGQRLAKATAKAIKIQPSLDT